MRVKPLPKPKFPVKSVARSRWSHHRRKLAPTLKVWLPLIQVVVLLMSHMGWVLAEYALTGPPVPEKLKIPMFGQFRWSSGMFWKIPVLAAASMAAWGQAMGFRGASAQTRPKRNEFTTLFLMGQVWETCQFLAFWMKVWSERSRTLPVVCRFSYLVSV